MNAERRKQIASVLEKIAGLTVTVGELKEEVSSIASDERDNYENMPEAFQNSEKGEKADATAGALEDVESTFDDIESSLADIETALNEAVE